MQTVTRTEYIRFNFQLTHNMVCFSGLRHQIVNALYHSILRILHIAYTRIVRLECVHWAVP